MKRPFVTSVCSGSEGAGTTSSSTSVAERHLEPNLISAAISAENPTLVHYDHLHMCVCVCVCLLQTHILCVLNQNTNLIIARRDAFLYLPAC